LKTKYVFAKHSYKDFLPQTENYIAAVHFTHIYVWRGAKVYVSVLVCVLMADFVYYDAWRDDDIVVVP